MSLLVILLVRILPIPRPSGVASVLYLWLQFSVLSFDSLHGSTWVRSTLDLEICARRSVFCMNRAAFLTYHRRELWRIVRRSIQLSLAFLTSPAHIIVLISLNRVHSVSTCLTVSSPLLHTSAPRIFHCDLQ